LFFAHLFISLLFCYIHNSNILILSPLSSIEHEHHIYQIGIVIDGDSLHYLHHLDLFFLTKRLDLSLEVQ